MILLTPDLRERPLANAASGTSTTFPLSNSSTLLALAPGWQPSSRRSDQLFGLTDLGFPELGYWSLSEMQALRLPFGLGIERDLHFEGAFPLSIYAEAARQAGRIVFSKHLLQLGK
jgi:hypothetical protein